MGCHVSCQLHTFVQLDGTLTGPRLSSVRCPRHNTLAAACSHLQAWVFAAIDDETQAAKYYAFAAVYALPLIRNGFQFDSFLAAAVLMCAAHVQVGWHAAYTALDRQGNL